MKIVIIGAAGMIGARLARRIAADGRLNGRDVERLILADAVPPSVPDGWDDRCETHVLDIGEPGAAEPFAKGRPDVVFHLAAIVSGEAEADFAKGYRVNLDGTRALFDAIREENARSGHVPRVVFASSIAVFGAPFPASIPDDFALTPLTSYGTQKAIGELLLADYTRRGFMDGIGLRLPTICIRPGRPNKAASGFFSNILREPLRGEPAVLPVSEDVRHFFASPSAAVEFFLHAAAIDGASVGPRRNISLPGLSATVGDEIAALERVAGPEASALIRREPDETIRGIVAGWAPDVEASRARALGFRADASFDDIIRAHLAETGSMGSDASG
ncbi:D-erythronate dehydrogenase [Aureimonas jatrophae]|uniref:Nucleoside-diphosphate-sugar epimerase n=1 Tax=Aureimonas jatrophae TaxID=1166073 RepID=A0A1H0HRI6_9HYPH|nr:D-erythronate dehydrogenase [Aureimonas jatrophae]MBB3950735.1 nucleoside-diphosphate-sugar epimerase [Aureimonas jatrophae]SDO21734.1 Nucleoside-diphosphate-sugar epimerase [Aureimonas jatrophae]